MATAYFDPGGWLRTFWDAGWFAGLIPVLILAPLLYAVAREGKWPRRRLTLWTVPLVAWAVPFSAAQVLAMWALQQRPPALIVTAGAVWCAPWRETAQWGEVASVDPYNEKRGRGWQALGRTLHLTRPASGSVNLRPAQYDSALLRWGIVLARWKPFTQSPTELPCALHGLTRERSELARLLQEIHFKLGPRVGAPFRARNHCWVRHCLTTRGLDYACVANIPSDSSAQPCAPGVDH